MYENKSGTGVTTGNNPNRTEGETHEIWKLPTHGAREKGRARL